MAVECVGMMYVLFVQLGELRGRGRYVGRGGGEVKESVETSHGKERAGGGQDLSLYHYLTCGVDTGSMAVRCLATNNEELKRRQKL